MFEYQFTVQQGDAKAKSRKTMFALFLVILATFIWCVLSFYWSYFTTRDLPPGPFPLPLVGNLLLIGSNSHVSLAKLAAKHGNLMTVYFGSERAVIVSSSKMAREVLVRQSYRFGGRPLNLPYGAILLSHGGKNIAFREDMCSRWKKQRKIFHAAVKMFGSGLTPLERQVCDVVEDLTSDLEVHTGTPRDVAHDLFLCVSNIICAMTFGTKYKHDDPEFNILMKNFDVVQRSVAPGNLIDVIPLLRKLPLRRVRILKSAIALLNTIVSRKYYEHTSMKVEGVRDITDALRKQYVNDLTDDEKNNIGATSDDVILSEEEIMLIMTDTFFAGIETSTSSVLWAVFYLALYSDIQDEIYNEMTRILDPHTPPKFSDRHRLPLLWATVTEVFRCGSIVPLLLPHRTTADASISGFCIPKDTTILVNAYAIHNDPKIWVDPHTFRPSRFLDDNGNYSSPPPFAFYPFSAGKRVCVGEILGKMIVFVTIARMCYNYRLTLVNSSDLGANEANAASIRKPKPFKVILEKRK